MGYAERDALVVVLENDQVAVAVFDLGDGRDAILGSFRQRAEAAYVTGCRVRQRPVAVGHALQRAERPAPRHDRNAGSRVRVGDEQSVFGDQHDALGVYLEVLVNR
ncbi:hypothetical protein ACWEPM_11985 [Streptomyces sp. NPDC004244]